MKIAVVGGSLTGPLTALLLHQAGFEDVTVFEGAPQSLSRAGGVIGLDYASLDVLDSLGLYQEEYITYTSERVVSRCVQENAIMNTTTSSYAGRNTSWNALHEALVTRLPRLPMTGTHVSDIFDGRLYFNGSGVALDDRYDLVIGADGRKSTVRKIFDPVRQLHYAGYVAHRGWYDHELPDLVDFTRFEALGHQFNVFPDRGGVDWTFYMEETALEFELHYGASPDKRAFVMPRYITDAARRRVDSRAYAVLPEAEALMVQNTTGRMVAPVMDIDVPTQAVFHDGVGTRVVLLGDALAPVRPHTARGMNNGIAQAEALVRALKQHRRWDADLDTVLKGWEQRVLPIVKNDILEGPALAKKLGLGPRH